MESTPYIFDSLLKDSECDSKSAETPGYIKEIRLAVIGNVDSGKSTLVGCLTRGVKDDGRGFARKYVFNYQHECESGRTSSIAEEIMGFKDGKIVPISRANEKKNVSWKDVASKSDHVLTLLDLCGHEKYLKTTMYGVTALLPDYAMILVGTNMGVQRMTKEHLGIVISLNVPFFVVFTKIDIAPKEIRDKTINTFSSILKTGLQKTAFTVKSAEDANAAAKGIVSGTLVPIFQVSTVTEEGMEPLKDFLGKIVPRHAGNSDNSIIKTPKDKTEMLLDNSFTTKMGCIHAGVVTSGKVFVNQKLLLGPVGDGSFKPVQVREIQFLRCNVEQLCCGNACSLRLKSLEKNFELSSSTFKKGMVLLDADIKPEPTLDFEIEALIVHHSSTIKVGYQSVVHCNVVRQTATIVEMNKEFLRAGDKGVIHFRFIRKPEFLHLGDIVLFREGRTRGKGKIIKIYPLDMVNLSKKNEKEAKKEKFLQRVTGKSSSSAKESKENKEKDKKTDKVKKP